jgi:hypothetical protein
MITSIPYVAMPRSVRWTDLSDAHMRARVRVEDNLKAFNKGQLAKTLTIVGPYGSGKSELMAWGFKYAWTELRMPAIFVNLETLLQMLPGGLGPTTLVPAIEAFLAAQRQGIAEYLEHKPRPDGVVLSTDVNTGESFLEYFRALFGNPELSPDVIRQVIAQDCTVLFLDEIEHQYLTLTERIPSSDNAPLREVLDAIDKGTVSYYLVGSFGLTSAYESMSDADARREGTVRLPMADVSRMRLPESAWPYRNLIWWASRGRPGWAAKFSQEWPDALATVQKLQQLEELGRDAIDSLPIIDRGLLHDVIGNTPKNIAFTHLLKALEPRPLSEVPGFPPQNDDLSQ